MHWSQLFYSTQQPQLAFSTTAEHASDTAQDKVKHSHLSDETKHLTEYISVPLALGEELVEVAGFLADEPGHYDLLTLLHRA